MQAPFTPTLYVTQPLAGGPLTPLNTNLGFFGIEPFFAAPCYGVGLGEVKENIDLIMTIYPNPAKEKIFVAVSNVNKNMKLQVYNAIGVLVMEQNNVQEETEVNTQHLRKGIYFVALTNGKAVATKKLVIN